MEAAIGSWRYSPGGDRASYSGLPRECYRVAIFALPNSPTPISNLASLFIAAGDASTARKYAEAALEAGAQ